MDRLLVDAGFAAFLGAIAGAVGAGVPPVVTAMVQRSTAKAQREHEKTEKDAQRDHERIARERAEKVEQIREWREGLAQAHAEYRKWDAATRGRKTIPGHLAVEPNIVGAVWFQSLRPHLSKDGAANDYRSPTYYRDGDDIQCDNDVADVLSKDISRIEQEWSNDEPKAQGEQSPL